MKIEVELTAEEIEDLISDITSYVIELEKHLLLRDRKHGDGVLEMYKNIIKGRKEIIKKFQYLKPNVKERNYENEIK